jgi:hypothetical protein
MADDLAHVLELLHGSGRRWRTLRAEGEEWVDEQRAADAFRRSTRRGAVFGMRGAPGPADRDPWWKAWLRQPDQSRVDFGGPHASRYLVIGTCSAYRLPAALDLQVRGRTTFLGREAFTVGGRPRVAAEPPFPWSFGGADQVELRVDAERGVVLWLELRAGGQPFRRIAMTEVAFDEDLDDALFAFPEGPETPPPVRPMPGRPPTRTDFGPPDDVLGRPVAVTRIVARTPGVVVAVQRVTAYPTGFEMEVTVRTTDEAVEGSFDRIQRRVWGGTSAFPGESLRVGVVFADGRRTVAENFRDRRSQGDVTLLPMGGGGSQSRFDQRYWVAPLPPPGPLGVEVEWEARDVPETRVDLDGAAILAAAAEAEALWG